VPDIAYYNGEITALDDTRVSVHDRAVVFGDGVYEVVKVVDGKLFAVELHLDRFYRSAAGIELTVSWDRAGLRKTLEQLLAKSGYRNALIYWQLSRGIQPRQHYYPPSGTAPSLLAWVREFKGSPAGLHEQGVKAILRPDERWPKCWIKSLNLLPNCMARDAARRADAYEAILVGPDGLVNECSACNVFAVIDGVVRTAPRSRNILWGISRQLTIQCARSAGIALEETAFSVPELLAADEVFLTSTSPDVLGIVEIDGQKIAGGKPGPMTMRLLELFRHYIRAGEF
jgi:D-alanine transaminase